MALIEAAMPSLGATSTDIAMTATNEMKAEVSHFEKRGSVFCIFHHKK